MPKKPVSITPDDVTTLQESMSDVADEALYVSELLRKAAYKNLTPTQWRELASYAARASRECADLAVMALSAARTLSKEYELEALKGANKT